MKRLINLTPPPASKLFLGLLPFALLLLLYVVASDARLAENANDKLLPAFSQMGAAIDRMALEPSKRTGEYMFWQDTASSLKRLALGVLALPWTSVEVGDDRVVDVLPLGGKNPYDMELIRDAGGRERLLVALAGIFPGHHMTVGSRQPASNMVPFPSRRGRALPAWSP